MEEEDTVVVLLSDSDYSDPVITVEDQFEGDDHNYDDSGTIVLSSDSEESDSVNAELNVHPVDQPVLKKEAIDNGITKEANDDEIRFFGQDSELPYIDSAPNYFVETAVEKIFNVPKERICSKQPIGVTSSCTFFIDLSKLSDRADIRADDLGVWINQGVHSKYCSIQFENNKAQKIQKYSCKPAVMRASVYHCKRSYWYHAEDGKFVRRLIEVEDFQQNMHPVCILQYFHPSEADIVCRAHKNSKEPDCKNYVRTKTSVLTKVKKEAAGGCSPTVVFDKIFEDCGGVMGVNSCGSLPRNKKQISNIKAGISVAQRSEDYDPLFALMEQCKKQESQLDQFTRFVQGAPDPMCVLANDKQLHDLKRFCCNPNTFSILGIDPTFNLGQFSVTVTTYRHLQLLDRTTRKPPVLLGPMLVHQRKTMQSYHFLASSIVGLCPDLVELKAFGTDGEKALENAFALQFKQASHLLCFLHVKDSIIRKLREIGICGESSKSFMYDIFGKQEGTHRYTGLVDAENTTEFDKELGNLKKEWDKKECDIRSSTQPVFFDWFCKYQANAFRNKMLKSVRQKCGLGNRPNEYTNNANESVNARIKEKVNYKKNEVDVFCQELVDTQYRNVERAFTLNTGPYMVSPDYSSYQENPTKWVKRSQRFKQKFICGVHNLPLLHTNDSLLSTLSDENVKDGDTNAETAIPQLSIAVCDTGLPQEIYGNMWTKAAKLVVDKDAITNAPGLKSSKMVASQSNPRKPHLVSYFANGKFTCDCLNYSTKSMCSHVLATAEKLNLLKDFLDWHKKNVKTNRLWDLATSSGVPKNPGGKPTSTRKRSRKVLVPVQTTSKPDSSPEKSPANKRNQVTLSTNAFDTFWNDTSVFQRSASSTPGISPPPIPIPHYPWYGYNQQLMYPPPYQSNYSAGSPPPWYDSNPSYTNSCYSNPYSTLCTSNETTPSGNFSFGIPDSSASLNTIYEPSPSTHPFTLKFLTSRIKKCQGCKESFQSSASSSDLHPLDNLIVSRLERRPFIAPDGSVKIPNTEKNSHYHLSMSCLTKADSSFHQSLLVVPSSMNLSALHKQHLQATMGLNI